MRTSSYDRPGVARSPTVTVIIPVYRAGATLPAVLAALREQVSDDVEVVAVESSGLEQASALERAQPWITVLGLPERTLPGRARNLGVARSRGRQLVFLDADAVPAPNWLERLRAAAADGAPAVAGAVANGTPGDPVGTASYLLEFSEFMPGRQGEPQHAASCNLLVDRSAFEAAGGFPEDLWPGEDTVLTVPWARRGELAFAGDALVSHLNRTRFVELLRHQDRLGRAFAVICDRVEFPYGTATRWPWIPFAPFLRLLALLSRLRALPSPPPPRARLSPIVAAGLLAWTRGLAAERGWSPRRSPRSP